MAKEKILIVEDEEDIAGLLKFNLEKEGYTVYCVESGEEGLEKARTVSPDLVLLDLMLPEMDGLKVCRELKKDPRTESVPVIMLTAKGEESDIVTGLEMGAEDYIPKPFSVKVLVARVRTALRRAETGEGRSGAKVIKRGEITLNPGAREVSVGGTRLELTFSEFEILFLLMRRPGWVFSRGQIVNEVKGDGYHVTERSIDVQIVSLRKKLGECGSYIETVRGVGYKLRDSLR